MYKHIAIILLLAVTLNKSISFAANNKGGTLKIKNVRAWRAESLLGDGDGYWKHPVIHTILPKKGKTFLVVSAQIAIDWTGFPEATQYMLKTTEIMIIQGTSKYKPIGNYRKGGRFSFWLSSSLFPQKSAKSSYYLDIVFCGKFKKNNCTLKIGSLEIPITIKPHNEESDAIPATFEIMETVLLDEFPSGDINHKAKDDCVAVLKPVTGKFLKLKIKVLAQKPYGENIEGLYKNDSFPLSGKHFGIITPEVGYIPFLAALSSVTGNEAYVDARRNIKLSKQNPSATVIYLFCVPENISMISLLYNKKIVVKNHKLNLIK